MKSTLTIKSVFGIVILSVLLALCVGTVVASIGLTYLPKTDIQITSFLALFIGQGFMIVPLLFFLIARKEPLLQRLRIQKVAPAALLATVVLSIGIIIIVDEFDRLASLLFTPPEYMNNLSSMLQFNSFGMALFLTAGIVLLAPLGEELLFRGFLQQFLEQYWQDITRAVLVTSLFFAIIHMNPFWLIQIYILGLMLGYLTWRTGSIWAGFILHSANNFVALMFSNFDTNLAGIYTWHGHVAPWFLVLGIACVYLGFTWLNQTVIDR